MFIQFHPELAPWKLFPLGFWLLTPLPPPKKKWFWSLGKFLEKCWICSWDWSLGKLPQKWWAQLQHWIFHGFRDHSHPQGLGDLASISGYPKFCSSRKHPRSFAHILGNCFEFPWISLPLPLIPSLSKESSWIPIAAPWEIPKFIKNTFNLLFWGDILEANGITWEREQTTGSGILWCPKVGLFQPWWFPNPTYFVEKARKKKK